VTRPEVETVATALLLELQAITRPVSTLLAESSVVAESCAVAPTCSEVLAGDTDTDATDTVAGALTFRIDELLLPPLEALMLALPAPTALTLPPLSTVATVMLELSQVIARPESSLPLESWSVAVAVAV